MHRPDLPPFVGGESVQLLHREGVRRDYSLVGPGHRPGTYAVAVQREDDGRGGSRLFHASRVDDAVFVSHPRPGMSLVPDASLHVFVAGGIGVTAVAGLLRGLPTGADGVVHYCVRTREDAVLLDALTSSGLPVHIWDGSRRERLDVAATMAALPRDAAVYHCGPPRLMRAVQDATVDREPDRIRSESFTAAAEPGLRLGDPFMVRLVGSGRDIRVAQDESLLAALLREGIPVDHSCEGGICGACVIEAADGDVVHRDRCLEAADRAAGFLATCVSRGRGDISLLL